MPGKSNLQEMPRVGVRMFIPDEYEGIEYFGRGPHENYHDRKSSASVGKYISSVSDQYTPYINTQENENRTDVRWLALINEKEEGILFTGMPLFSFSALRYTMEDHTQEKRGSMHTTDQVKRNFVSLHLDPKQRGVGGNDSWGALTLPQYRLMPDEYKFYFRISPFQKSTDIPEISGLRTR